MTATIGSQNAHVREDAAFAFLNLGYLDTVFPSSTHFPAHFMVSQNSMCICRTVSLSTLLLVDALGWFNFLWLENKRQGCGKFLCGKSLGICSGAVGMIGDIVLISCLEISTLISVAAQVYVPTSSQWVPLPLAFVVLYNSKWIKDFNLKHEQLTLFQWSTGINTKLKVQTRTFWTAHASYIVSNCCTKDRRNQVSSTAGLFL